MPDSANTVDNGGTFPKVEPIAYVAPAYVVSGYEIVGELGRGAMGVVHKARHVALNRTVALKMVLGDGPPDERAVIRFLAEAEAVAAIDHPHVVRVFDYGESEGRPFMALEYLDGGTLAAEIARTGRLPYAEAAALVEKVARGVHAAHELGIVHRDLKPANILLSSGKLEPKVTDFGLAKRTAGAELTQSIALMGTPGYMSPEQAGGRAKFVGPAADIWALGVILYECLRGSRPFDGDGLDELLANIQHSEPTSLRTHDPAIHRDLDTICLKCLEKDPARRYATAADVGDDLRRFRAGEPIAARPPTLVSVMRAWAGQNFGSAGWAVPGGIACGIVAGGYTALEMGSTKLNKAAEVYERLPGLPKPWFAVRDLSRGPIDLVEVGMYLSLLVVMLATAALVRPRNRSADVTAGMITGLFAAFAFFAVGLGWWTVYVKALSPTSEDLALIAGTDESLIERYPMFADIPPAERRGVLADKIFFELADRVPGGILVGLVLSIALTMPTCTLLVCVAAQLLRRHRRLRSVAPLYMELMLPAVIFAGHFFLVFQRAVLSNDAPEYPEAYAAVLTLTGVAVWAAATGRAAWVRIPAQLGWIAVFAVANYYVCLEF